PPGPPSGDAPRGLPAFQRRGPTHAAPHEFQGGASFGSSRAFASRLRPGPPSARHHSRRQWREQRRALGGKAPSRAARPPLRLRPRGAAARRPALAAQRPASLPETKAGVTPGPGRSGSGIRPVPAQAPAAQRPASLPEDKSGSNAGPWASAYVTAPRPPRRAARSRARTVTRRRLHSLAGSAARPARPAGGEPPPGS